MDNNQTPLNDEVAVAIEEILALRHLTSQTGTVTYRTQNQIFQRLSPKALAKVAVELKRLEDEKGGQQ